MYGLKVRIRAYTDENAYPPEVESIMTDYDGQTHIFRNALTAFTAESAPMIPGDGVIRCRVLCEEKRFAVVDTALPDNVESVMGQSEFRVAYSDLTEDA